MINLLLPRGPNTANDVIRLQMISARILNFTTDEMCGANKLFNIRKRSLQAQQARRQIN